MRIMIINTFYHPNIIGGTENSIKILAEKLSEKGNEVFIVTCDAEIEMKEESINGVNIIRLPKNKSDCLLKKIRNYKKRILILSRVLDAINPDIVNTNNIYGFSPLIWKVIKRKNIKVVHTIRDYWLLCPKGSLLTTNDTRCINPKLKCKSRRRIFKYFYRYIDGIIAPSKFTLNRFIEQKHFSNKVIKPIHNCIDFDISKTNIRMQKKINRKNYPIKFLFIGNLLPTKGLKELIQSFNKIDNKDIELHICGDGELRTYVEEQSILNKRIIYYGKVFGAKKDQVFEKCDVLVIPSIWDEPFGRVILEAYTFSMPVIGSTFGGIPEVIEHNKTGVVINPLNQNEIINALVEFSDREKIHSFIGYIPEKIKEFSVDSNVEGFERMYNELCLESKKKNQLKV